MFKRLRFSDAARKDLLDIQIQSHQLFGAEQALRYKKLLGQAFRDIDDDPERPGSRVRRDLGKEFRSYRVDLSRDRSRTGVRSSRHVVIYLKLDEDTVGVSRILHDAMVMENHIPAEHRGGEDAFRTDEEELRQDAQEPVE